MNLEWIIAKIMVKAWNEKGTRFYDLKSGKRSLRVSIMSGLCQGKLIAPLTFEGSCNRLVFEKWLEEKWLPLLNPGQILILDNATFHKADATPRRR